MRTTLGSILIIIGGVLATVGMWMWIRDMPGQEVVRPGLVLISFGFMFRMLGPAPPRNRRDREP